MVSVCDIQIWLPFFFMYYNSDFGIYDDDEEIVTLDYRWEIELMGGWVILNIVVHFHPLNWFLSPRFKSFEWEPTFPRQRVPAKRSPRAHNLVRQLLQVTDQQHFPPSNTFDRFSEQPFPPPPLPDCFKILITSLASPRCGHCHDLAPAWRALARWGRPWKTDKVEKNKDEVDKKCQKWTKIAKLTKSGKVDKKWQKWTEKA